MRLVVETASGILESGAQGLLPELSLPLKLPLLTLLNGPVFYLCCLRFCIIIASASGDVFLTVAPPAWLVPLTLPPPLMTLEGPAAPPPTMIYSAICVRCLELVVVRCEDLLKTRFISGRKLGWFSLLEWYPAPRATELMFPLMSMELVWPLWLELLRAAVTSRVVSFFIMSAAILDGFYMDEGLRPSLPVMEVGFWIDILVYWMMFETLVESESCPGEL